MLPRKITSLQEDMQKLGLTRLVSEDINGKTPQRKQPVTESTQPAARQSPKTAAQVAEAKKQIKAQKARAAAIREDRMKKKLATYETRLQRIERQAKKKGRKVESRLRFIKGLKKRAAVMESYDVRKELGEDKLTAKALAESFGKVASLSGALGRAFGCMEQFFGEEESALDIPVIHPDSAYGYDVDHSNAANNAGSGEVTDYGTEKANEGDEEEPKDDMAEDDEEDKDTKTEDDELDAAKKDDDLGEDDEKDDDEVKEDDDVTEDDEEEKDAKTEGDDEDEKCEDDDEKDDTKTEDDEPADKDKKMEARRRAKRRAESIARRMPMDYELHTIRLEAEEMAASMVGDAENVNLGYASSLMNDMVSYLGGAMKLYFKLQNSMKTMGYVGQDQPAAAGGTPVATAQPNDAYIGTVDKPQGETAITQTAAATAPKTGTATDTGGTEAPKAS